METNRESFHQRRYMDEEDINTEDFVDAGLKKHSRPPPFFNKEDKKSMKELGIKQLKNRTRVTKNMPTTSEKPIDFDKRRFKKSPIFLICSKNNNYFLIELINTAIIRILFQATRKFFIFRFYN